MFARRVLSVVLLLAFAQFVATFCPAPGYKGNIYSGTSLNYSAQVSVSLDGGLIPLQDGEDVQCYAYSLPYAFATIPDVAIAIHSFNAEPSNNLYFYIKSIKTDSLNFIPFIIRTQWPYTTWTQISFNFIAEDRSDIESGYYQLDSGSLAGCENGKSLDVIMPFRMAFDQNPPIQANVYLHGFDITTVKIEGTKRTPFEIQVLISSIDYKGIIVTISVTTATRVDFLYVSYVAFQAFALPYNMGHYIFDSSVDQIDQGLFYVPQTDVPPNFARLYGIAGFLINFDKQAISFTTEWNSISFVFGAGNLKLLNWLSFSYIFFTGSECQDCPGLPIIDNGLCISQCPAGTYLTSENTCINCGKGREWDGKACVTSCPTGQFLNTTNGRCECPQTLNWDGQACVGCTSGKVWASATKTCECPIPLIWNGFACAKIDPCTNGKVWDVYTYSCQCPDGTFWDGASCKSLVACVGGQIRDINNTCVCPSGFEWIQNFCVYSPCQGGQVWTGTKCVCPVGLYDNGVMCLECINGQKWDAIKKVCACDSGYEWNGQYCQKSYKCSNGRVWNPIYQQCICADGSYWSGYACLTIQKCSGGQYFDSSLQKCACLSGSQWNGTNCVECKNGKIWNITTLSCNCPLGTILSGNGPDAFCKLAQSCSGGKDWNAVTWECQCPENSYWNGVFCILNPCTSGQKWNETIKTCVCPFGKVWNNVTCVPPQIVCTNGRIWSNDLYACTCPSGTFATPTTCSPVPSCPPYQSYNPLNNKCQCQFGLQFSNGLCIDPKCPVGQYFNGDQCQIINCPPPTYFLKDRCVFGDKSNCDFGFIWNGRECQYYPNSCPSGTSWTGFSCQSTNGCGNGYFSGPSGCTALPQQCPPPAKWDGTKCTAGGSLCPKGTYAQGTACLPFTPCTNGFVWDPAYLRCVCTPGTINNGNQCVPCPNDQKWSPGTGCSCPDGTFDSGASCETPNPSKCAVIANSYWDQNKCLCRPGFTKVGFQCVCYGTQLENLCDKCSYKPNSKYNSISDTCECGPTFTEIKGVCVKVGTQIDNSLPENCAVGTYFDGNHKACLACTDGCLSCNNCYQCKVCRPEFIYDQRTQKCFEFCGDGKRFNAQCDDGNNEDGDGCSRDCKIESGYSCTGGSPQNKDTCTFSKPSSIIISQTGQIRRSTSIVLNLKINYLPKSLLNLQCQNKCNQILIGTIMTGESAVAITSEYIPGTSYQFTMSIEFGRIYMAKFRIKININTAFQKYFGGIGLTPLEIDVNPTLLMAIANKEALN